MAWIVTERIDRFVSKETGEVVEQVDTGWGIVTAADSYMDIHVFDSEHEAQSWALVYGYDPSISDWYDGVIVYLNVEVQYAAVHDRRTSYPKVA